MRKALLIIAGLLLLCWAMYWINPSSKKPAPKPVPVVQPTTAQFITLQTHVYFVRGPKELTQTFQRRFSEYAAGLMGKYEKVTIEYYINEDGDEQAVVIAEKKCRHGD